MRVRSGSGSGSGLGPGRGTLLEDAGRQGAAVGLDACVQLLLLQQRAQWLVVEAAVVNPPDFVQGHEPEALRRNRQADSSFGRLNLACNMVMCLLAPPRS